MSSSCRLPSGEITTGRYTQVVPSSGERASQAGFPGIIFIKTRSIRCASNGVHSARRTNLDKTLHHGRSRVRLPQRREDSCRTLRYRRLFGRASHVDSQEPLTSIDKDTNEERRIVGRVRRPGGLSPWRAGTVQTALRWGCNGRAKAMKSPRNTGRSTRTASTRRGERRSPP